MAIKTMNNTVGPNSLILTFLVYRAYLYMTNLDPLTLTILQYVKAIKWVIEEITKTQVKK